MQGGTGWPPAGHWCGLPSLFGWVYTLNAIRYLNEILGLTVRPYPEAVGPGFLLVHNNAQEEPCGNSMKVVLGGGKMHIITHPCSSDLNPVEHFWDNMYSSFWGFTSDCPGAQWCILSLLTYHSVHISVDIQHDAFPIEIWFCVLSVPLILFEQCARLIKWDSNLNYTCLVNTRPFNKVSVGAALMQCMWPVHYCF